MGIPSTQARPSDILDEIIDRVDTTTDRIRGRIHEINDFFDRIVGPTPEKMPSTHGSTVAPTSHNLEASLDRLNTAVNDLEMTIARGRRS